MKAGIISILRIITVSPVLILWLYSILEVSSEIYGLYHVITGIFIIVLAWYLRKHNYVDYPVFFLFAFLFFGLIAQLGVGFWIESLFLILPGFHVIVALDTKKFHHLIALLTLTYIYTILQAYLVDIGLSYKAGLAVIPAFFSSIRVVLYGGIPEIMFYEPMPGLIVVYALATISLILLMIHEENIIEVGPKVILDSMKILIISSLIAFSIVAVSVVVQGSLIVFWTITILSISVLAIIAYRKLAKA